jgi:hypothetical protein
MRREAAVKRTCLRIVVAHQYRYRSLPVGRRIAATFGYDAFNGSMAAWTAAYLGNAFGCCRCVEGVCPA